MVEEFDLDGGYARAQGNLCDSQMILARSSDDSVMVDALAQGNPRGARSSSQSSSLAISVHHSRGPIAVFTRVPESSSPPDPAVRRSGRDRTPRGCRNPDRRPSSSRTVVREMDTNLSAATRVIHGLEAELLQARA